MARKRNSTFAGVRISDVDVDAPTYRRAIADVIGDNALTHDILTGENSPPAGTTITHAGGARGCPLGVPLVNQFVGATLALYSPAAKDTHGGKGAVCIAPLVVTLPPGESAITVDLFGNFSDDFLENGRPRCELRDATMTPSGNVAMDAQTNLELFNGTKLSADFTDLSPGRYFIFPYIHADTMSDTAVDQMGFLRCVSVNFGRVRRQQTAKVRSVEDTFTPGVWTPSATEGVVHRSFDEAMLVNLEAIDGNMLQGSNYNLNGLEEFTDAWPPGGYAGTFTHEDHDSGGAPDADDPARSRFHAHTRSLYANEPEVHFPVMALTFGACLLLPDGTMKFAVDLAEPPTIGMLDFHAPWPISTSLQDVLHGVAVLPDFDTAASKLKMDVFIGSDGSADVGDWTLEAELGGGVASAGVSPVALDGTNCWWLATITDIPFLPDVGQPVTLRMSRTGAKGGIGELCILAAQLYFDP